MQRLDELERIIQVYRDKFDALEHHLVYPIDKFLNSLEFQVQHARRSLLIATFESRYSATIALHVIERLLNNIDFYYARLTGTPRTASFLTQSDMLQGGKQNYQILSSLIGFVSASPTFLYDLYPAENRPVTTSVTSSPEQAVVSEEQPSIFARILTIFHMARESISYVSQSSHESTSSEQSGAEASPEVPSLLQQRKHKRKLQPITVPGDPTWAIDKASHQCMRSPTPRDLAARIDSVANDHTTPIRCAPRTEKLLSPVKSYLARLFQACCDTLVEDYLRQSDDIGAGPANSLILIGSRLSAQTFSVTCTISVHNKSSEVLDASCLLLNLSCVEFHQLSASDNKVTFTHYLPPQTSSQDELKEITFPDLGQFYALPPCNTGILLPFCYSSSFFLRTLHTNKVDLIYQFRRTAARVYRYHLQNCRYSLSMRTMFGYSVAQIIDKATKNALDASIMRIVFKRTLPPGEFAPEKNKYSLDSETSQDTHLSTKRAARRAAVRQSQRRVSKVSTKQNNREPAHQIAGTRPFLTDEESIARTPVFAQRTSRYFYLYRRSPMQLEPSSDVRFPYLVMRGPKQPLIGQCMFSSQHVETLTVDMTTFNIYLIKITLTIPENMRANNTTMPYAVHLNKVSLSISSGDEHNSTMTAELSPPSFQPATLSPSRSIAVQSESSSKASDAMVHHSSFILLLRSMTNDVSQTPETTSRESCTSDIDLHAFSPDDSVSRRQLYRFGTEEYVISRLPSVEDIYINKILTNGYYKESYGLYDWNTRATNWTHDANGNSFHLGASKEEETIYIRYCCHPDFFSMPNVQLSVGAYVIPDCVYVTHLKP